jgi:hypothetical protein
LATVQPFQLLSVTKRLASVTRSTVVGEFGGLQGLDRDRALQHRRGPTELARSLTKLICVITVKTGDEWKTQEEWLGE